MFTFLLVLLTIVAILMTGIILLQKSEGSGMSGSSAASMLGGVLTGAAAGNFLTRLTAWLATIFFVLCALLALVASKTDIANQQSSLRSEIVQQSGDTVQSAIPGATGTESETVTETTTTDAPAE